MSSSNNIFILDENGHLSVELDRHSRTEEVFNALKEGELFNDKDAFFSQKRLLISGEGGCNEAFFRAHKWIYIIRVNDPRGRFSIQADENLPMTIILKMTDILQAWNVNQFSLIGRLDEYKNFNLSDNYHY